jgi:hypothetical protein
MISESLVRRDGVGRESEMVVVGLEWKGELNGEEFEVGALREPFAAREAGDGTQLKFAAFGQEAPAFETTTGGAWVPVAAACVHRTNVNGV